MAGQAHKGGKKNRKYGRNKKWCEAYRLRGQREINKRRNLKRHLRLHPNDKVCVKALAAMGVK